jgi:hypothetical protein
MERNILRIIVLFIIYSATIKAASFESKKSGFLVKNETGFALPFQVKVKAKDDFSKLGGVLEYAEQSYTVGATQFSSHVRCHHIYSYYNESSYGDTFPEVRRHMTPEEFVAHVNANMEKALPLTVVLYPRGVAKDLYKAESFSITLDRAEDLLSDRLTFILTPSGVSCSKP